jgi:hypothetical protein
MFYISSIFYTRRFKRLIADLKHEGSFTARPLRELDRNLYILAMPLIILCILFFLIEGHLSLDLIMTVTSLWAIFGLFSTRYVIKKIIIPCTIGTLQPVFIEENPVFHPALMSIWGWSFRYCDYDANGNLGGSYKSPHIPKQMFDKDAFLSQPTQAFFDPENSKNNCPRISGLIHSFRMTTRPVPEIETL